MKICKECNVIKQLSEFSPCGKYKDKIYYRGECKDCNSKMQSSDQTAQIKYRNSENGRAIKAAYKKTREYKNYDNKYRQEKRKNDPLFKCKYNLRDRLRKALNAKKWNKNTKFNEYIGCSLEEVKMHLELQFQLGMTWNNHGEWEIDHIIPLSSAKTPEEMYKLCHYSNLQPLWAKDNLKKSNKI